MKPVLLLLAGLIAAIGALPASAAAPDFVMHNPPKALPDVRFRDANGQTRTIANFRNEIVLLNVWATWCVPCRKEMPTLDRLQKVLGGNGFEVVALSIDRGGLDVVRKFYGEIGISHLAAYVDPNGKVFRDLAIVGLPTTLLIDRAGRELGRHVGPADWDAPDTIAFIRKRLDQQRPDEDRDIPTNSTGD